MKEKNNKWKKKNLQIILYLINERLKVFPQRSEMRQQCLLLQLLFSTVLEVLARAMRQEKEFLTLEKKR